eukprot:668362-Rhodomonas_salina.1
MLITDAAAQTLDTDLHISECSVHAPDARCSTLDADAGFEWELGRSRRCSATRMGSRFSTSPITGLRCSLLVRLLFSRVDASLSCCFCSRWLD